MSIKRLTSRGLVRLLGTPQPDRYKYKHVFFSQPQISWPCLHRACMAGHLNHLNRLEWKKQTRLVRWFATGLGENPNDTNSDKQDVSFNLRVFLRKSKKIIEVPDPCRSYQHQSRCCRHPARIGKSCKAPLWKINTKTCKRNKTTICKKHVVLSTKCRAQRFEVSRSPNDVLKWSQSAAASHNSEPWKSSGNF